MAVFKRFVKEVSGVIKNTPEVHTDHPAITGNSSTDLYQIDNWLKIRRIQDVIAQRERGMDPQRYGSFYDYALSRWGSRLPARKLNVLVLGCSSAKRLPHILLDNPKVGNVLVVDNDSVVLENLLDEKKAGIECWQMDLNTDPLPRGPFDVVACDNSLNNLRAIKHIGNEIEKVIDRSGLFLAREYVGPNNLQFTESQMSFVNALLMSLPKRYHQNPGATSTADTSAAPGFFATHPQSSNKAIRSEDIEKMIHFHFRIMEEIHLGGTILAPLLVNIYEHFNTDDKEVLKLLDSLLDIEMRLIDGGLLKCDYKAFICRPS